MNEMTTDLAVPGLGFGLSAEQQMIVDTVRDFVEREIYPHEELVERTGAVAAGDRRRDQGQDARARLLRLQFPGGGWGCGPLASGLRAGRARARPRLHGAHPFLRPAAEHPDGLHARPARALSAPCRARREDGCAGDDRARCGLGRARHEDLGAAGRRRLGAERDQAFHLWRRACGFRDRLCRDRRGRHAQGSEEAHHLFSGRSRASGFRDRAGLCLGLAPRLSEHDPAVRGLPPARTRRCSAPSTAASR